MAEKNKNGRKKSNQIPAIFFRLFSFLSANLRSFSLGYSELPAGETWHLDLFKRFCSPAQPMLPVLFDEALARQLGPFRRFRHVVHHGYGFQIEWDRMREGLEQVAAILAAFRDRVAVHVNSL